MEVQLRHMGETADRFWQSNSNKVNQSSNMFFTYTQELASNIRSGKGYWCGYGTHTLSARIK